MSLLRLLLPCCALMLANCGRHLIVPSSPTGSAGTPNAPVGSTPTTAPTSDPTTTPSTSTQGVATTPASTTPAGSGQTTPASAAAGFAFGPYKDVTINANWNTGAISTLVAGVSTPVVNASANFQTVTWSFATGECGSETWGGITATQMASANVQPWAAAGKKYILATGGASGSFTCTSDAGFATFLDRYASASLVGVDFDIEAGQSEQTIRDLVARVKAAQASAKYRNLRFSFTLATLGGAGMPSLGDKGVLVMQVLQDAGVSGVYINLMAMDYGAATANNCVLAADGSCNMGASAVQAAMALNAAYKVPFAFIEITPMLGGNDTQGEVFTLEDVATVAAYAKRVGLGGVHYWSLDRDNDCSQTFASPSCNSYGKAGPFGFLNAFTKLL